MSCQITEVLRLKTPDMMKKLKNNFVSAETTAKILAELRKQYCYNVTSINEFVSRCQYEKPQDILERAILNDSVLGYRRACIDCDTINNSGVFSTALRQGSYDIVTHLVEKDSHFIKLLILSDKFKAISLVIKRVDTLAHEGKWLRVAAKHNKHYLFSDLVHKDGSDVFYLRAIYAGIKGNSCLCVNSLLYRVQTMSQLVVDHDHCCMLAVKYNAIDCLQFFFELWTLDRDVLGNLLLEAVRGFKKEMVEYLLDVGASPKFMGGQPYKDAQQSREITYILSKHEERYGTGK